MITEPRSTWRHADFLKLWSAETISLVGTQVTALALPLTAILRLNASTFQVGLLASVQYLPFLVVGLPAGSIVDRLRRLPVLVSADLGRAALLIVVPLLAWLGQLSLGVLYPVAFAVGVLSVFSDIALQSYLPSLVSSEQIVHANAKLELSYSGSQLAGPGLGGILVQTLTAPIAIVFDVASYLCSAVLLLLIRRREPTPTASGPMVDLRRLGRDILAGLRFVFAHRLIRPLALATGTANFFYLLGMTGAILALFAVRQLHVSPLLFGVVLLLGNVGSVAGALASTWVLKHVRFGVMMVIAPLSAAAGVALIALATPATAVPQIAAGVIVGQFGVTIYDISQLSLRQAVTPADLLGRMNATVRFVNWGPIPIGAFLGGVLGQAIGLRDVLWLAVAGCLLPGLWLGWSAVRTLRSLPTRETVLEGSSRD